MKKIVVVTKKFGDNFTGATITTQRLLEKWIQSGYQVAVYTLQCGEIRNELVKECAKVHVSANNKELVECISKEDIDAIYYSDDHLGYLIHKGNRRYYHTYHGNWPDAKKINFSFWVKSFYFIPCYKKTIRSADKVVNVSEYMSKFTKKYNTNSVVIRNGVDINTVSNTAVDRHGRILMVGNVDKRKYEKAFPVLSELARREPDVKVDIYGSIVDKTVSDQLLKIPNVTLRGMQKSVPYHEYAVLINTSTIENLAISVCEALKSGTAVVCFDVGGLSEVIEESNGSVVDRYDTSAMVAQIQRWNKSEGKIESQKMREFDWDICAEKYISLFENDKKR